MAAMLCMVPPERRSEGWGGHGSPLTSSSSEASAERLAVALVRGLGGQRHAQVGGERLEAAHLHDLHPRIRAGPSNSSIMRRTNGISPVRST